MAATGRRVTIVGGGLAGTAAAIVVARAGYETLHLSPKGPPDRRTSALMQPTVEFLRATELIGEASAIGHPLTEIRIIDATGRLIRAPETLFRSAEVGLPAFGWNFSNAALLAQFEAEASALPGLTRREAALAGMERDAAGWTLLLSDGTTERTDLLVGADGKKSFVRSAAGFRAREHGFTQAALVCDLELERPIGGTSIEFHYAQGPFTLVPAGGSRANLVWIDDRDVLREAQKTGTEALAELFAEKTQHLFGRLRLLTPAHMFLLSTLTVPDPGRDGVALVGEAAHAFPPIGAQGLNLGLRDIADLEAALAHDPNGDRSSGPAWADAVSADYAQRRATDLARTGGMVDALFRSLLSDFLPTQAMRAGGLWALKLLPPLRRSAFALGMGSR